jgi:hypothetical protein
MNSEGKTTLFEIAVDIFRVIIAGAIFFFLRGMREKEDFRFRKGWIFAMIGFGLIFFGSILDITDNFPELDQYVIIGKTKYEEFLEQVVGYTCGFIFVAIGLFKWIPTMVALRKEEESLKKSHEELRMKIEDLRAELNELYRTIEHTKSMTQKFLLTRITIPAKGRPNVFICECQYEQDDTYDN